MKTAIRVSFKIALISFLFTLAGCSTEPEPIHFGEDQCAYCKMNIVDPKYGAELVTDKGKVYKFDAIECLVQYQEEHSDINYAKKLVIAYDNPKVLYTVDQLVFMQSDEFNSPMGGNVAAYTKAENAPGVASEIQWEQVEKKFSLE